MEFKTDAIGGQWLVERYGLVLINPLAVNSRIATRRHTTTGPKLRDEAYQEVIRPDANLRGHLTFHLKHEVVSLELLSRVFALAGAQEIIEWLINEPGSQYARRCAFLYEWLTGDELKVEPGLASGKYVDVLDPETLVCASSTALNARWRVRDNMPGTPDFCPTVRLTPASKEAMRLDCQAMLDALQVEFGDDTLLKSAVWLTLRESKASFQIEGEQDQKSRITRFADVLHTHTGTGEPPLDQNALAMLQKAILGDSSTLHAVGLRRSPVFVGQTVRFQEVIHYVAPAFGDVPQMLQGLTHFLQTTEGQSPIMRAAVASFGFVYIHPLADGNGRVHRFLINDVLRRDAAVPEPLIIPVSGLIAHDVHERKAYDKVLDEFSKPLMAQYREAVRMEGEPVTYQDGIKSNFKFAADDAARHAWRFMDLTAHVEYLSHAVSRTIREEMREEAAYLRDHGRARLAIKEVIEMPDHQVDRVIRAVEINHGQLSGALAKEFPLFEKPELWAQVVQAVRQSFARKV